MKLSIINKHPRDDYISFKEENHIYIVDGNSNYTSVTTWIHSFFPHFDSDIVISKMRNSKNWVDSPYYGKTDNEIKELWSNNGKEASKLGTEMHLNIEYYYNGLPFNDKFKNTKEYIYFNNYLKDHKDYIPFRTEWSVYTKKYLLAGSIDMVYFDPKDKNKIVIADWKRSKEIKYKNNFEKAHSPINDLDNCNYWHYTLQLNIYRMILEKYYTKKVSHMFLVVIHPDNHNYIKIPIPIITKPIIKMLNHRLKCINL